MASQTGVIGASSPATHPMVMRTGRCGLRAGLPVALAFQLVALAAVPVFFPFG